ncbi:hypothetical protein ADK65_33625 [Streptomyces sp. NRRL B-1140]|nr:hypothetical protein ADK65_33625 [Streptomyces sp. NRRL B-1140]
MGSRSRTMMVGPATNTNRARISASTMLVLDSHWMPFSTPEIADATKARVSTAMIVTSSPVLTLSIHFSSCTPEPIWSAPRPREAAEPKTVAMIARTSMARPMPPLAFFLPMSGVNTALMVWRRRLRKVL